MLIKRAPKGRHKKSVFGINVRSRHSLKQLASFVLRLIGEAAKARQMQFQFQSNTRQSRPVLSTISLALQIVRKGVFQFPPGELNAALARLRRPHPALQL